MEKNIKLIAANKGERHEFVFEPETLIGTLENVVNQVSHFHIRNYKLKYEIKHVLTTENEILFSFFYKGRYYKGKQTVKDKKNDIVINGGKWGSILIDLSRLLTNVELEGMNGFYKMDFSTPPHLFIHGDNLSFSLKYNKIKSTRTPYFDILPKDAIVLILSKCKEASVVLESFPKRYIKLEWADYRHAINTFHRQLYDDIQELFQLKKYPRSWKEIFLLIKKWNISELYNKDDTVIDFGGYGAVFTSIKIKVLYPEFYYKLLNFYSGHNAEFSDWEGTVKYLDVSLRQYPKQTKSMLLCYSDKPSDYIRYFPLHKDEDCIFYSATPFLLSFVISWDKVRLATPGITRHSIRQVYFYYYMFIDINKVIPIDIVMELVPDGLLLWLLSQIADDIAEILMTKNGSFPVDQKLRESIPYGEEVFCTKTLYDAIVNEMKRRNI